jgi:hypothetical protein
MKSCVLIFMTICLFSCQPNKIIDDRGIVRLVLIDKFRKHQNMRIVNIDSISMITKEINKANWEPAIFISRYELDVYYKNNIKMTVLFRGDMLSLYGKTYRLDRPIEALVIIK